MFGCLKPARIVLDLTLQRKRELAFRIARLSTQTMMTESVEGDAFRYSSGRWIYNEAERLRERHLPFNIHALARVAARSAGRDEADLKSIRKLAEGGFNRVFELTMRDGLQLIARLPYPSTLPKQLAVASEVATMDIIRHYGIPTPKFYDYSSNAENPVGVEYIIMEKVGGRPLGDVWFSLSDKERIKILSDFVGIEAKLFAIDFPAHGSIFYEKDLPKLYDRARLNIKGWDGDPFCIGPDTSLELWFQQRSSLKVSRGPFMTTSEVLLGIAKKEMEWLKIHGRPRLPSDRVYRDITRFQKSDPMEHYRSLEMITKVIPQISRQNTWLDKPILRHPDANPNNIFVSDDHSITSIIDWQNSNILPLSLSAGIPSYFQNYGDPDSESLKKPKLPDDLDQMDEYDRQKELELYRRRHLHFYYLGATASKNKVHFRAMQEVRALLQRQVFTHAGAPWEGNNIPLKADLVGIARRWSEIVGGNAEVAQPCPFSFGELEAEKILQDLEAQEDAGRQLDILRDYIGVNRDGWVSYEDYEEAVRKVAELKETALKTAEDEDEYNEVMEHWAFDDYDEKG